jgi:hypothetical protein
MIGSGAIVWSSLVMMLGLLMVIITVLDRIQLAKTTDAVYVRVIGWLAAAGMVGLWLIILCNWFVANYTIVFAIRAIKH